ncbi:MAG: hypothetical protein GAK30_02580 [Paracidovorax wautersii]|uniref:ATP-binding cassette, subfamily B, MsbA n=1 Tax=Paracidovorax wautersii TaxID=1177982 RepID=A0A7V8JPM9_9BURK|nr:MAG: hypothetical protein GAK30_02580 [Paracidovorax wautersii]
MASSSPSTLPATPPKGQVQSLSRLLPFLRPYRLQIVLALVFLVLAAAATLAFPVALRHLIDGGLGAMGGPQALGEQPASNAAPPCWPCASISWPCSASPPCWACSRPSLLHRELAGRAGDGRPAQRRL